MDMPQFLEAMPDASPNRDRPIIVTAGTIVNGVTNRSRTPVRPERIECKVVIQYSLFFKKRLIPVRPNNSWDIELTIIAP